MKCFCIIKLDLEIKRIDEDLFQVRDNSLISYTDLAEARRQAFKLKVNADDRFEFIIDIPVGGSVIYSSKELGIECLRDCFLCFEVESCGQIYKQKYLYSPNMICAINELVMKEQDDERYRELKDSLEVAGVLAEQGRLKAAEKKYSQVWRILAECGVMVGSRPWRPVV